MYCRGDQKYDDQPDNTCENIPVMVMVRSYFVSPPFLYFSNAESAAIILPYRSSVRTLLANIAAHTAHHKIAPPIFLYSKNRNNNDTTGKTINLSGMPPVCASGTERRPFTGQSKGTPSGVNISRSR